MEKPIIFLDFDGVLNTEQYQAELAISRNPVRDEWGPLFSARAVGNLKKIVEATNADIVVTSTWRFIHGLAGLKKMWSQRSMPGKLRGILPCDSLLPTRGEEISEYLSGHQISAYVILDDLDEFMDSLCPHFIPVNPIVGISEIDVQKATSILNVSVKDD